MVHNLVTITHRGKPYAGAWMSTDRLITVTVAGYARKTAHLGNSPPGMLAKIMLRELAEDQILWLPEGC